MLVVYWCNMAWEHALLQASEKRVEVAENL